MSERNVLRIGVFAAVALAVSVAAWASQPRQTASGDEPPIGERAVEEAEPQTAAVPGELIVKFREPLLARDVAPQMAINGATLRRDLRLARHALVSVPLGQEQAVADRLARLPFVESVERNAILKLDFVPNDEYYSYQWSFPQINMPSAWDVSTGSGVVAAVVDSGVAYENCSPAVCGDTYARAPDLAGTSFAAGYDFGSGDTHANDRMGHGTHVAGTIAQTTNNDLGVAGVAYNAAIMPVKIANDQGILTIAAAADGIVWAADNGAQIINMSFGSGDYSTLEDAINYALDQGVVLVASTGNGGSDQIGDPELSCPACYPGVIAVGATRYDQTRSPYSNYGSGKSGHTLDLVAPGGDIEVDQNGDGYGDGVLQESYRHFCDFVPEDYTSFAYCFATGTSMAAPHVVGVAALMLAVNPSLTAQEVRDILTSTATDLGPSGYDLEYGYGLVNAYAAVLRAIDVDEDGVPNTEDNCPDTYNPDQLNTDAQPIDNGPVIAGDDITVPNGDSSGNACDPDDDNDWLNDTDETTAGTNPLIKDTDGDRVIDGAEVILGSNPLDVGSKPSCVGIVDNDRDCLPADAEALFGSSDLSKDTDGDGINDAIEVLGWGTSPISTDTDGDSSGNDGCRDDKEIVSINDDGVVDSGDRLIIALRAARVRDDDFDPDPPWNFSPAFDLNKDGYIDSGDRLLVTKNSGAAEPHNPCS